MLRNDKNTLVTKLYNEVNLKHRSYNTSIDARIRRAREEAIQNMSLDLKEFIAIATKRGYAGFIRQIIADMTFSSANIPQRLADSSILMDEIRGLLETINDKDKLDKQVEEELKQKIADKYKTVINGATTSPEVQPGEIELVISPLQKLGAND